MRRRGAHLAATLLTSPLFPALPTILSAADAAPPDADWQAAEALFKERFPRSPLAPGAMLRAGVLSASPRVGDFRQAREWFDLLAKRHPGTPEALAAEFYSATLAWRGRKWAEAERLHKAFAAAHPDSPLARVALEERLPAIAERSLEAPLRAPADRTNEVIVNPGSRKRSAFPISKDTSYNAQLDVKSADLPFKETWIEDIDSRGGTVLWTGPEKKSKTLHRYHLSNAYTSREYVMVRGDFLQPAGSGGGGTDGLPPFRVTVPSVDVDWTGFEAVGDETGEETRFVIVPLNTNRLDDTRHVLLWDPYDDDERNARPTFPHGRRVNPDITLDWDVRETFLLVDSKGAPHSQPIEASGGEFKRKNMEGALKYTLAPLSTNPVPKLSFRIYAEGQETPDGKALDTIRGRAVLVDLDIDANGDGAITDDDEPLEENPGGYACLCTNNLTPVKLKVAPVGLPGRVTLSAPMGGQRIKVWQNANRTGEVVLPKEWNSVTNVPSVLHVEGVTNSIAVRDIALTLTYDENPPNESNTLFRCEDKVQLTVLSVDFVQKWETENKANQIFNPVRKDDSTHARQPASSVAIATGKQESKFWKAMGYMLKLAFLEPWRCGFAYPIAAVAVVAHLIHRNLRGSRAHIAPQPSLAAIAAFVCLAAFALVCSLSLAPSFECIFGQARRGYSGCLRFRYPQASAPYLQNQRLAEMKLRAAQSVIAAAETTLSEFLDPCERMATTASESESTSGSSPNRSLPSRSAEGN